MQRTGLNPPCHRLTPLPVCRHRRPSRAAPGPVGAPSRLCVSVCVHLCDVYPCACVAEQSCSNDTLCRGSLQAEQAPRVLQVTRGLQLPPTALTGPSELFPGSPTWARRTPLRASVGGAVHRTTTKTNPQQEGLDTTSVKIFSSHLKLTASQEIVATALNL